MSEQISQNVGPESATGVQPRKAGRYVLHDQNGQPTDKVLFALNEQQADAFERLGYRFDRDLQDGDIVAPVAVPSDTAEATKNEVAKAVSEAVAAVKQESQLILEAAHEQAAKLIADAQQAAKKTTRSRAAKAEETTPEPTSEVETQTESTESAQTEGEE